MNAGTRYAAAKLLAQANATLTQSPRWLHVWGLFWWITKEPTEGAERVDPEPRDA